MDSSSQPQQQPPLLRLADFFSGDEVLRDGTFSWTLYPKSTRPASLCYAGDGKILDIVNTNPSITAVITTPQLAKRVNSDKGVLAVEYPEETYYHLHNLLVKKKSMKVHSDHRIDSSAVIAPTAIVGQHVVLEKGVVIEHHAIVEDFSIIGESTYVGPNVCIGARGMQNSRTAGRFVRLEFGGGVKIGKNCEILASAIIQRPYHSFYTEIGDETQVSVKVTVGHGARVGSRVQIGGNAQIAGNVQIGDDVWIGQSATISDGVKIGAKARITMASAVISNVAAGATVSGNFAYDHTKHLRDYTKHRYE